MYSSIPQPIATMADSYRYIFKNKISLSLFFSLTISFFSLYSCYSPMASSLGSMASSCLQQRDTYPYMFHDPLSLSAQYAAHPRPSCNPAAAHQQSAAQHGSYAAGPTGTTSTGIYKISRFTPFLPSIYIHRVFGLCFLLRLLCL